MSSTEEALNLMESLNNEIDSGMDITNINILRSLAEQEKKPAQAVQNISETSSMGGVQQGASGSTINHGQQTPNVNSTDLTDTLIDLKSLFHVSEPATMEEQSQYPVMGMEQTQGKDEVIGQSFHSRVSEEKVPLPVVLEKWDLNKSDTETVMTLDKLIDQGLEEVRGKEVDNGKNLQMTSFSSLVTKDKDIAPICDGRKHCKQKKRDIRCYFKKQRRSNCLTSPGSREKYLSWVKTQEDKFRRESLNAKSYNETIAGRCRASDMWSISQNSKQDRIKDHGEEMIKNIGLGNTSYNNLQDMSRKPVFLGGDAVALYPPMDDVGTAEMIYQTILDTKISFPDIDYMMLAIYLKLVLEEDYMNKMQLTACVPERIINKKSKARSLAATTNRNF